MGHSTPLLDADTVDSFRIEVRGIPRPWVRPQRAGGRARKQQRKDGTWVDPPAVAQLKALESHVWVAVQQLGPRWISNVPVEVDIQFIFGVGKFRHESKTVITVRRLEPPTVGQWRTMIPDADNLAKLVGEALQHGGALDNDSQIVRLVAEKIEIRPVPRRR